MRCAGEWLVSVEHGGETHRGESFLSEAAAQRAAGALYARLQARAARPSHRRVLAPSAGQMLAASQTTAACRAPAPAGGARCSFPVLLYDADKDSFFRGY